MSGIIAFAKPVAPIKLADNEGHPKVAVAASNQNL